MVRIACVRWWRYAIPFRVPFHTAHGVLTQREGVLFQLIRDDGRSGWGEIAPLPGFGGSLERSWRGLLAVAGYFFSCDSSADPDTTDGEATDSESDVPAALRCGLQTAAWDFRSQDAGCPLAALWTPQPAASVPVNATVGEADTAGAVKQAALAVAAGFATIKLKVGRGASIGAEVERVAAVREAIGLNVQLRLDANEAWAPEPAITVIRAWAPYQVELVEQPVAAADVAGLARVRRAVETPIAADESVKGKVAVQALLAAEAVDVLILKPMLAGGPATTLRLAALAAAAGVSAIVTSTLETGIGLAAALHAAAALPPPLRACGLATAALLEDDLLEQPLPIVDGQIRCPQSAGLGVLVDQERLRHYTTASGEVGAKR